MQECAGFIGERRALAAGASSFGMSGVNAHGLFTAPAQAPAPPGDLRLPWRATRHWMAPQNVVMLQRYLHGGPADTFRRANQKITLAPKFAIVMMQHVT